MLKYLLVYFQIGLSLVGIVAVIAIVNPWLMIPTAVTLVIFYFYRIVYLSTSRSVKRIEGISKFTLP